MASIKNTKAYDILRGLKMIYRCERLEHVPNGGAWEGGKLLVYQNKEKVPGLMTHVARVLSFADYAERNGYHLVVDMKTYKNMNLADDRVGIDNTWEYYYEQPFGDDPSLDEVYEKYSYDLAPALRKIIVERNRIVQNSRFLKSVVRYKKQSFIESSVPVCLESPDNYKRCCEVYRKYIRFNQKAKEYTDAEVEKLLSGHRVLGVSVRGTDYTVKKPYAHNIQPDVGEVIQKAREYIETYGYDKIYLSCEEHEVVERFEKEFPGMILINDRQFFDHVDFKNSKNGIWAYGFDRENDEYLRGLEYLSSMNVLSKCDALIAGINTGSQMAYIMNDGEYEHVHFYNLGRYGIDDQ